MKGWVFLAIAFVLATPPRSSRAQDDASAKRVMNEVVSAIRQADANALSKHFHRKLEVNLPPNAEGEYSKDQATFIFKEYFMNHPVDAFSLLHRGHSNDTHYAVGQYESAKGRFDVNIFIGKRDGTFIVEEIRFEKI